MIYSTEVQRMCPVAKGAYHGPAAIPEEGKWVQATQISDISGLTPEIFLFCVCFVVVALITKIIGCGLAAKLCRFNWGDSFKIGVGMMTRGEVALIVAQKGLAIGVVDPVYFTAVILLIVVSSVATPLALKAMFTKHPPVPHPSQAK